MIAIGSLFSGYGGLESAVRNVFGGDVAWVSDIDPGACRILAHHWPDVPNLGDITRVDWSTVEPVDVITGGSPCQDLSHAGKRGGMKTGTRSNLWVAMREAIAQLRPSWVVWENVRGAYSAEADSDVEPCPGCVGDGPSVHLRALGRVLGDLADLGYDAAWHGLTAASVGAPHGRYRVFLLAWPQPGDPDVRDSEGRTSAGFAREAGSQAGSAADADRVGHERAGRAWGRRGGPADSGHAAADAGCQQRPKVGSLLGQTEAESDQPSRRGAPTGSGTDIQWGQFEPAIRRWERLTRPAPAPTELSAKGSQRLSPRFVEWMQGLPAGHVTDVPGLTRNEQLKALGNGVVPQQAEAALRVLLNAVAVAA